jgi:hypothetical protein
MSSSISAAQGVRPTHQSSANGRATTSIAAAEVNGHELGGVITGAMTDKEAADSLSQQVTAAMTSIASDPVSEKPTYIFGDAPYISRANENEYLTTEQTVSRLHSRVVHIRSYRSLRRTIAFDPTVAVLRAHPDVGAQVREMKIQGACAAIVNFVAENPAAFPALRSLSLECEFTARTLANILATRKLRVLEFDLFDASGTAEEWEAVQHALQLNRSLTALSVHCFFAHPRPSGLHIFEAAHHISTLESLYVGNLKVLGEGDDIRKLFPHPSLHSLTIPDAYTGGESLAHALVRIGPRLLHAS